MSRELSTLMREFLEPAVVEVEPDISIFGSAIVHVPIQAQQDTWEVVDSPKRLIKDFNEELNYAKYGFDFGIRFNSS